MSTYTNTKRMSISSIYTEEETKEVMSPLMSPITNSEMYMGALMGCVLCSKLISITQMNPYSVTYTNRFPYSEESRFIPVYCTPCVNSSLGFCSDTRISKSMIRGTEVYAKAGEHTGLGSDLKIRPIRSMYLVMKANNFLEDIMPEDILSVVDERHYMGLRPCRDMSFFEDVSLPVIDISSPNAIAYE